ncbi:tRNA guanosine(34) transglycosylase Tgt [Lolliginicoccus suaedae]|uniref:tRNA guanosine(34) transglycosylase Tgt n=1 Tax=Lolliginicoccus suaedae TaxID=2605429 RepID=UPI0011EE36FA|nr:tRNA guanosine(34) transglycosylase Tgt [Lolliginicoccus suaedae]
MPHNQQQPFDVHATLDGRLGRTGTIQTPHGTIETPAFIPVGTKATVKALLPETVQSLGAQAVLANAYHLYLQPGSDIIDEAGGLGRFMNWPGPTFTDSGGFQVLSMGSGFRKILAMELDKARPEDIRAHQRDRLAHVDDDGVNFKSHINGSKHRFTPEVSLRIQHEIGADIMFAFDELTTLVDTRDYQVESVERTRLWAQRSLDEHERQTEARTHRPYQSLFGVVQGAQYEDLRREAARGLAKLRSYADRPFDGYGIGGALEKHNLGTIVRWVNEELPFETPKHMLGISEPDDLFTAIENGADTFDCVSPSRVARNAAIYLPTGRVNMDKARFKRDFNPIDETCDCYTCGHYTRAYLHHLYKSKEFLASTLATIHNERFIIRLVDQIRDSINGGYFADLRADVLGRYYAPREG